MGERRTKQVDELLAGALPCVLGLRAVGCGLGCCLMRRGASPLTRALVGAVLLHEALSIPYW